MYNINDTLRYLHIGLPGDILRHKMNGNLEEAVRLIDLNLQRDNLPKALRCCLIAQREIMLRQPADYPYTYEEMLGVFRESIPDFSEEEFKALEDAGRIGWMFLHGEKRYFERSFATLCKTEHSIAERAGLIAPGAETGTSQNMLIRSMNIMKEKGQISHRIRIRASLRVEDEAFTPGMFIRAHLPIAADCPQQSDIRIEKVEPDTGMIAPADALQRTVCWEENMQENHPFVVEYSYTHTAKYHDTSAMTPSAEQPSFCTEEEAPHIVFTPYIRELVNTLTEGVTDPLEKARRFYDFITLNMKYSFQPEYFVLESIAENCARNFTGDCGVFALLFITLCRCAGIPAQWQSGLCAEPDDCGCHDWAMFYIAPYGWLFADPSFGVSANRCHDEARRQFYFGNLDAYRMVANRAFQADFTVNKQHWRADPYDNQTGEMETTDRGLRYEEYEREYNTLECTEI